MTGPRLLPGSPVPLFDRLIDQEARSLGALAAPPTVQQPLDRDGLIFSIAAEVSALLNTRCPRSREAMASRTRTTLDYGVPDLSSFQPFDSTSEVQLAHELEQAILAFEPRLLNPRVQVRRLTPSLRAAFLQEWSERAGRLGPNRRLRAVGAWYSVLPREHDRRSLLIDISGRIRFEDKTEPVGFPILIRDGAGGNDVAG